jgi:hypothetical protein
MNETCGFRACNTREPRFSTTCACRNSSSLFRCPYFADGCTLPRDVTVWNRFQTTQSNKTTRQQIAATILSACPASCLFRHLLHLSLFSMSFCPHLLTIIFLFNSSHTSTFLFRVLFRGPPRASSGPSKIFLPPPPQQGRAGYRSLR